MSRRSWRLLRHAAGPGPWNMGVDEALLASAAARGEASLRLYTWSGPWLSLGYAQPLEADRAAACAAADVGVVRRSTGGGAVLHGADLTYALAAPEALLPRGLEQSYARLAEGLCLALGELGVALEPLRAPVRARQPRGFDCFAQPAAHELCAGGRKLVGSAQRRAPGALLQHGSVRLAPDPPEAASAAGLSPAAATSLRELGCDAAAEAVGEVLAAALSRVLGAELREGALRPEELAWARLRGSSPSVSRFRVPRGIPQGAPAQADRY